MIDIGLILKELRVENNYTQAKLAKRLGVSITTVGTWESGQKLPAAERLIELARLYNVPINYIAGIEKEKSIVLDDLTQKQQNLLKTMILEFQDKSENVSGLTERQKDILSELTAEFQRIK